MNYDNIVKQFLIESREIQHRFRDDTQDGVTVNIEEFFYEVPTAFSTDKNKIQFHNENGPAVIFRYKNKIVFTSYYVHGREHRLDGPSMRWAKCPQLVIPRCNTLYRKGNEVFYINGKSFSKEAYWQQPEVILFNQIGKEGMDVLDI